MPLSRRPLAIASMSHPGECSEGTAACNDEKQEGLKEPKRFYTRKIQQLKQQGVELEEELVEEGKRRLLLQLQLEVLEVRCRSKI